MFCHRNPGSRSTRIRLGFQPKLLDPDPESMNPDPKHWILVSFLELDLTLIFGVVVFYVRLENPVTTMCGDPESEGIFAFLRKDSL
jgi:hypothetical protein